VRCELVNNTRNTFEIARLLRRHLGGPPAPVGGPESHVIDYFPVTDHHSATAEVHAALRRWFDDGGADPNSIVVATLTSAMRDRLRSETPGDMVLVAWEHRGGSGDSSGDGSGDGSDGAQRRVVCETVRRLKGTEVDHVVLVAPDSDPDDPVDYTLLYVGVSRAVLGLTVIAHPDIGARLGLTGPA
jgi:hypothetical protein